MIRGVSLQLRKCSVARWSAMAAQVVSLALLVAGCASGDPSPALGTPTKAESVGSMSQAVNGVDGVQNVLAGSVVVNQYTTLAANANAGDGTITVGSAAALNPGSDPLAAGDLLMIIQMQGATIDQSDPTSRNWGQVTSLGSAGNFELVEVGSVQANVITLVCGLKNSYVTSGAVQVIRVPQYTSVNVSFLAEIVAPAWNGTTGGVVAIRALNTINIGGTINANALGFRGGVADNTSDDGALDVTTYSSATATQGGGKGESIAGRLTLYGRGAPANGGGGGNSHNAAGGGGANARTALQAAWTGQGVMKNVTGATGGATDAWRLDPGYIANGNARTASQGGGRGGYTYSSANQNALLDAGAPGLAAWGGNSRRERGGLGGRPLDNSPTGRLFFGGGGGSGDANNGNQGGGGRGGGLVFLMAGSVTGGGSILANGAAGESSNSGSGSGDGPGGGGAGGSIIIQSPTLTNMTVRADGGVGGNQLINNAEAEGPGGGGGGGYLALPTSQTNVTLSALGALGGTTNSPSLTEFPTNGATSGNDGDPSGNSALVSLCTTGPGTTITTAEPTPTNDPTADFVFAGTPAGGTFECSLDNGAWEACTAAYSTAALADGSHTLRVRAVDSLGFRDSTPASHTWLLDTVAPDTTLTATEPSPTNDPTGDFTFTSPDGTATFECSIDGGAYVNCTSPLSTAALTDGQHTLGVRAKDPAGNVDASPATHTWTVDTTAPETVIDAAEPSPTNDLTGDFVFSSPDATATFECSLDGGAYAACNATYSTPVLAQGSHTLNVRARDPLGNVDATPATHTWVVDLTAPSVAIDTAEPSPTSDPTGDFVFTSNDLTASFECSVDGAAFAPCNASFSTAPLADGPHTLAVRAKDPAGNVSAPPATYGWTVDTAAPETTIDAKEPNPTNDPTGDFTFTSSDPTATFECSIDGGAYANCNATYSTPPLADGPHTLSVRAKDAAGNVDATPETYGWTVDTTAPETTLDAKEPSPTSDPTGDFTFTSNDATATFECSIDGGAYTACTSPFSTPTLADGSHTLDVRAKDAAGNVDATPATHTWVVDTTAPETTLVLTEPNPTSDPTGDFTFTSNDNAALFECSIDGGAYTTCTSPYSTPTLTDGSHTLNVRAKDAAGNVDATPATHTWVVDATAPETTIATFEPNPTNDPTGDFTFTSNDPTATFECRIDGGAYADCNATYATLALNDGTHTLDVRAKDAVGNVDATPASYEWVVDTTPPDTTIDAKEPNPTNDPTGDFTFTSTESPAAFECSIDGGAYADCSSPYSTPELADGSHTLAVRAKDAAGNVDAVPATYTWTIDATAPDTAIQTSEPDPTNDTTGDFVFTSNEAAATFECSLDGGAYADCSATFSTAALPDGRHTLAVRAKDALGNVDATPAIHEWTVDTAPPDTSIPTAEPSPTNDVSADFVFASDEVGSTFECRIDAAAFAPCSAAFSTPALTAGMHTIEVRAVDRVGNVDPTPATYTWTLTAPAATDTDGDGLPDTEEDELGTDKNDADSDNDGVPDGQEQHPGEDPDGDGLINALDPDSDNDALFDGTELGITTPHADTDLQAAHFIADADPATHTNPEDPDTDDGTVPDGAEDANHNGKVDSGERNPLNPADDVPTPPLDSDDDGLTDTEEETIGTDPLDADSDDDGVLDGAEPNPTSDTDGDGKINPLDPDSDNDGLFDGTELGLDCSEPDTDPKAGSCKADADPATVTLPLDPDTDDGGVRDGAEDMNLDGALDDGETDPTAGHPEDDGDNLDSDSDGLTNGLEEELGTDPNDADTDDDGLLDGQEPNPALDSDADGLTNPLDPDSDNDGLFDGTEAGKDCASPATTASNGSCIADADPTTTTSPIDPDTDDGGVSDGSEDSNLNGKLDAGETDPTAGHGADDGTNQDADADGLSNGVEATVGSDPNDADSDDDGLLDGQEPNFAADSDGDGNKNVVDPDSDNDGLWDGTEAGKACDNAATAAAADQCISDADPSTLTGVLDPDTDDGGVSDGDEDTNKDGSFDEGERDPLDPSDDDNVPGEGGAGGMPNVGGEAGAAGSSGSGGTGATPGQGGAGGDDTGGTPSGGTSSNTSDKRPVVLGGGICSVNAPGGETSGAMVLLGIAAAAAAVSRRRRRG